MKKRISVLILSLNFFACISLVGQDNPYGEVAPRCYYLHPFGYSPQDMMHSIFDDFISTTVNVLSEDSMRMLTYFVPLYIGGRIIDDEVHFSYYDAETHKNIDEPPGWLKDCSGFSMGSLFFPAYVLGAVAQFSCDENTRLAGGAVFSGIITALLTKEVFKQFRGGVRPLNEHYCPHVRKYNGFPSGHMVAASYLATIFSLRAGPKWGAPLWASALLVGGMTVSCNTHYVSQVVAGAAIGAMVAASSNRVIEQRIKKICHRCSLKPGVSPRRMPCLKLTYSF